MGNATPLFEEMVVHQEDQSAKVKKFLEKKQKVKK
jgi:hypothetical protein